MTLGHLTAGAANRILDGGALPTIYYAQQHTAEPGLAFDENVGPDTRRIAVTFLTAVAGVTANISSSSVVGAPADNDLEFLTLWDDSTAGECLWVVPLTGAPVAVVAGNTVGIDIGDLTLALDIWTQ